MAMRIMWQMQGVERRETDAVRPGMDAVMESCLKYAKSVTRPDTELTMGYLDREPWIGPATMPTGDAASILLYPRAVLKVAMLNRIIQAEREGYDAVVSDLCYGGFAAEESRQAVRIPVHGLPESAMVVAQLVGKKFALVAPRLGWVYSMESNIRFYGWEDRAIKYKPVRYMAPTYWQESVDAFKGKPDKLIANFEKVALDCIEDGADTIICACGVVSPALAAAGYHEVGKTGVPVVDPISAAVKLAEAMVDLRRSVGLHKTEIHCGPYQTTPPELLEAVRGSSLLPAGSRL